MSNVLVVGEPTLRLAVEAVNRAFEEAGRSSPLGLPIPAPGLPELIAARVVEALTDPEVIERVTREAPWLMAAAVLLADEIQGYSSGKPSIYVDVPCSLCASSDRVLREYSINGETFSDICIGCRREIIAGRVPGSGAR